MRKVNDCGTFVAADLNYRSKVEPNKTRAREINQTEVIMVDGHYVIPPATSVRSMELAIQKAKACGVGYVGVKHGSHFGAAGYWQKPIGLCRSSGERSPRVSRHCPSDAVGWITGASVAFDGGDLAMNAGGTAGEFHGPIIKEE